MTTDKANQHYVPKFYLRNFSFDDNKREIGVFNIKKCFFINRAPLKNQASKRFFYGSDGIYEDFLSFSESNVAPFIRDIIEKKLLPQRESIGHTEILYFYLLMEVRNPSHLQKLREALLLNTNGIKEMDSTFFPDGFDEYFREYTSNQNLQNLSLPLVQGNVMLNYDLDYKILLNNTSIPFLTSDFPPVRYNQLMERFNWQHSSVTGNGWIGSQLFLPLSPKYCIVFYDSNIYKVGDRKQNLVSLNEESSINNINFQQVQNCSTNLFFNEQISESYIKKLLNFKRIQDKTVKHHDRTYKTMNEIGEEVENSFIRGITEKNLFNKFCVEKIKIHSKGQYFIPSDYFVQFRAKALQVYKYLQTKDHNN